MQDFVPLQLGLARGTPGVKFPRVSQQPWGPSQPTNSNGDVNPRTMRVAAIPLKHGYFGPGLHAS